MLLYIDPNKVTYLIQAIATLMPFIIGIIILFIHYLKQYLKAQKQIKEIKNSKNNQNANYDQDKS